jgi:hypothetical protein
MLSNFNSWRARNMQHRLRSSLPAEAEASGMKQRTVKIAMGKLGSRAKKPHRSMLGFENN